MTCCNTIFDKLQKSYFNKEYTYLNQSLETNTQVVLKKIKDMTITMEDKFKETIKKWTGITISSDDADDNKKISLTKEEMEKYL